MENDTKKHYTFYKGVFIYDEFMKWLNKYGDLQDCESFQRLELGDSDRVADIGYIAEEECDTQMFFGLPKTLREALNL